MNAALPGKISHPVLLKSVYLELLKKAKSVGAHLRRSQRVWVKAAKTSLKELSKAG